MYTIEYKGTPFLFILKHVESAVEKLVTTQITLTPYDSIEMILRANPNIERSAERYSGEL